MRQLPKTVNGFRILCALSALFFMPAFALGFATVWAAITPVIFAYFLNLRFETLVHQILGHNNDQSRHLLKKLCNRLIVEFSILLNLGLLLVIALQDMGVLRSEQIFGLDAWIFDQMINAYEYGASSFGYKIALLSGFLSVFTVLSLMVFSKEATDRIYDQVLTAKKNHPDSVEFKYFLDFQYDWQWGFMYPAIMTIYFTCYYNSDNQSILINLILSPLLTMSAIWAFISFRKSSVGHRKMLKAREILQKDSK